MPASSAARATRARGFVARVLPRCTTAVVLACLSCGALRAQQPSHRVLVVNSYTPTFPTTDALLRGIREGLGDPTVHVDVEFLASKAAWNDEYAKKTLEVLRHRFEHREPYELIIATDDHAVDLLAVDGGVSLSGPIVAVGVNHPRVLERLAGDRVTGAVETVDVGGTLELARALQPSLERVIALVDGSQSGNGHLDQLVREIGPDCVVESMSLGSETLESACERLAGLTSDTAVFLLSAHMTKLTEMPFEKAHRRICAASGAPCYTLFRFALDAGPVGGAVIDMYDHGKIAGERAKAILAGAHPRDFPVVHGTPSTKTVVRAALPRWPELAARVPEGVVIHAPTQPASSWSPLLWIGTGLAVTFGLVLLWRREHPSVSPMPIAQGASETELGLASIGRVASSMVHDLNNLLMVVQGYGNLIEGDEHASANVRRSAEQIVAASNRARRLARRVLNWSKSRHGAAKPIVVREHVQDLAGVLQEVLNREVSFQLDVDPTFAVVDIDPVALDQLLLNIVINARDAGATEVNASIHDVVSDTETRLLTGTIGPGRWVVIEVTDNGAGVDPRHLPRVTEEYFSTKGDGGTGIGLATVSRLTRTANGGFTLEARPEGGTRARVWLPASVSDAAREIREPLLERAASITGSARVWVVDDDPAVCAAMARSLEAFGYGVRSWSKPSELSEQIERLDDRPDVLVLDLRLPEDSGSESFEDLNARIGNPSIVYVGCAPEHWTGQQVSVLDKPFDAFEFVTAVHRASMAG